MNIQLRRQKIEETLRAEGFCNVTSLAKVLGVSEVTIRNDLSVLEDEGKVSRIHGGAILTVEQSRGEYFEGRTSINQGQKLWIARRGSELVENYDSILLDASTTAFYMANYLKNHRGLTIFTNGIEVAFRLAENRSNKVILIGGLLRPETASLAGHFGTGMLGSVRANKAFFSCTGWSPTLDLMDDDVFEAQLKKEMIDAAESVILLMDSSKFKKQGVAIFTSMSQVDMVITDDQIKPAALAQLKEAGVQLNICSEYTTRVIEGGDEEKRLRIGFANQDNSAPFQTLLRQGLMQAATNANIELLLVNNRENGPTALANVEYFIQEKVDLVVEFNTDIRYNNVIMERLRTVNIPVIAIDIPMPGATFVGVDNYRAGLMAGHLAGTYAKQKWKGQVDKVLSLGLPSSGPVPAARIQGQIDGLREAVEVTEEQIIQLDSKNTYSEAHRVVATLLPTLHSAQTIIIFGINDDTVRGALAAFEEAGTAERVIAIGQGADQGSRQDLQKPGSRMIGAVASFPEHYGKLIINAAMQVLQGQQIPPAVYTQHILVLSEETIQQLNLEDLTDKKISVLDYDNTNLFSDIEINPTQRR